ncbi:Scr1 family TA system antitoxin-like transcriptional regulator [Micromonospora sp. HM5-17]|uniref:helix-turn-helix domain-containing protein n=1 Tax=Micromonospora sp. HM5-17 TaxID=2487710 RepID=UPI0018F3D2EB|nr:Scr1 family TA system antitoxin-like transcriptional regulator [Micromonospora sp. HM5-17]
MLEHFAEELRLARVRAEMSQAELAEACNYSAAMIAKVETCERRPSLDLARRCDAVLGTGGLLERIQRRIGQESVVGYFQEFAGIEQEAKALRCFQPTFIPGLLQTEPYARAVLSSSGLLTSEETEEQVATRLHRQEILTRATPPLGEPVAYLEGHIHGKVIDHPEQVRHMLDVWDSIRGEALPHQRSIELIAEVAQTWS